MPHIARAILAGIWGAGAGKPSLPSSCLSILSTVPTTDPGGHHAPLSQPRKGKLSWSRHAVFGLQSHLAPLPHRTWFCSSHCESCAIKKKTARVCRAHCGGAGFISEQWGHLLGSPCSPGDARPGCAFGWEALAPCHMLLIHQGPWLPPATLIMHCNNKEAFSLTREAYLCQERAFRPHKIELSLKALLESIASL